MNRLCYQNRRFDLICQKGIGLFFCHRFYILLFMIDQEPVPGKPSKEDLQRLIEKINNLQPDKKPEIPEKLAKKLAKDEIELDQNVDAALEELNIEPKIPAKPNSTPLPPELKPPQK